MEGAEQSVRSFCADTAARWGDWPHSTYCPFCERGTQRIVVCASLRNGWPRNTCQENRRNHESGKEFLWPFNEPRMRQDLCNSNRFVTSQSLVRNRPPPHWVC